MSKLRVTASVLNVRESPSASSSVVGRVSAGDTVETRLVANVGPWRAIRTATGVVGWAHGDYLTPVTEAAKPARRKWRVAKSLDQLLKQINARAPGRNDKHDGSIGDAAHAARDSDHNSRVPPRTDPDRTPVVLARDYTHDPAHGADMQAIVSGIVASRDQRVSYIIFNRRIWRSYNRPASSSRSFLPAWKPEKYTGKNPHTAHAHVSVVANPALYDDASLWRI